VSGIIWGRAARDHDGVTTSPFFKVIDRVFQQPESLSILCLEGGVWLEVYVSPGKEPYEYTAERSVDFHPQGLLEARPDALPQPGQQPPQAP
jgi:hypothetical protein